eukprot:Clim_evm9s58 gene=Clim_evmTU9s58
MGNTSSACVQELPATEREWIHFLLWEMAEYCKGALDSLSAGFPVEELLRRVPVVHEAFHNTCGSLSAFLERYRGFFHKTNDGDNQRIRIQPHPGRRTGIIVAIKGHFVFILDLTNWNGKGRFSYGKQTLTIEDAEDSLYLMSVNSFGKMQKWEEFRKGDLLGVGMMVTFTPRTDLDPAPYFYGVLPVVVNDIPPSYKRMNVVEAKASPNRIPKLVEGRVEGFKVVLRRTNGAPTGKSSAHFAVAQIDQRSVVGYHSKLLPFLMRYSQQVRLVGPKTKEAVVSSSVDDLAAISHGTGVSHAKAGKPPAVVPDVEINSHASDHSSHVRDEGSVPVRCDPPAIVVDGEDASQVVQDSSAKALGGKAKSTVRDYPTTAQGKVTFHSPETSQEWINVFRKVLLQHNGGPIPGYVLMTDVNKIRAGSGAFPGRLSHFLDTHPHVFRTTRKGGNLSVSLTSKVLSSASNRGAPSVVLRDLCGICLGAHTKVLQRPCGHVVMCQECSNRVTECPICKERITESVPVYIV